MKKMTMQEFLNKVEWEGGIAGMHAWASLQTIVVENEEELTRRLAVLGDALDAVVALLPESAE